MNGQKPGLATITTPSTKTRSQGIWRVHWAPPASTPRRSWLPRSTRTRFLPAPGLYSTLEAEETLSVEVDHQVGQLVEDLQEHAGVSASRSFVRSVPRRISSTWVSNKNDFSGYASASLPQLVVLGLGPLDAARLRFPRVSDRAFWGDLNRCGTRNRVRSSGQMFHEPLCDTSFLRHPGVCVGPSSVADLVHDRFVLGQ